VGTGNGASLVGILPLLAAGFIFNVIFYTTRFRLSKADGQRLFFACVIAGFGIGSVTFVACAALRGLVPSGSIVRSVMDWFHTSIPIPYGLTFVATIVLAVAAGHLANCILWLRKKIKAPEDSRRVSVWAYWRSMSEHVTALDELIRRAVSDDSLVLVCLKSRKVYCGSISGIRGTHESAAAHIQIVPSFSITRDKDLLNFNAETRTDYKAYSLKRAFDRQVTLSGEIQDFAKLVCIIRKDVDRLDDGGETKESVVSGLKNHARRCIAERKALRRSMAPYGTPETFDISQWVKVIPVSEIESTSLYRDDDYSKWFSSGGADAMPLDTET
jgi:hypothetical protein